MKKIGWLYGLFVFINDSKTYLIHQTSREFLVASRISEAIKYEWHFRSSDTKKQNDSNLHWISINGWLSRELLLNCILIAP